MEKEPHILIEEIYCKYERLMYFTAGKYEKDPTRKEDIVQTALVALLRKASSLQNLTEPVRVSYIVTAVRNTAINQHKRDKAEAEKVLSIEDVSLQQMQQLSAEHRYLELERREELLTQFHSLCEEDQRLLYGKYLAGLSDVELAKISGCKPASIRMKLTRARRAFMEKLKEGGIYND